MEMKMFLFLKKLPNKKKQHSRGKKELKNEHKKKLL